VSLTVLAVLGVGVLDPDLAVLPADDLGLTRGDGCFEGCRVLAGGGVDKLEAHLDRLARSAAALEIAFDRPAWHALVDSALAAWVDLAAPGRSAEAALKLVLTRGRPGADRPTGLATIAPLPADYPRLRRDGLRVVTLSRGTSDDAFRDAPWLLGGVKTLSYAVNMAAQREAVRRGADDAILVSVEGRVLESPTSSVVWSVGRDLRTTPTGASGILAGTTQQRLFERAAAAGWRTHIAPASVEDLHAADVLWLVGSVRGAVDVVELDGKARARRPAVDTEIRRLAGF
jgi:4-amino-4-deoxychorismate lyase